MVGELLFRGHGGVGIAPADGFDEEAFLGFAWDEGGSGVAAFEDAGFCIEEEATFQFAVFLSGDGVALFAVFGEGWSDALLEEGDLFGREWGFGGVGGERGAE